MSGTTSLHAPESWREWQQIAILAGAGEASAEDAPEVHRAAWLAARASVAGEHERIGPLVLIRMARAAAVEAIMAERRRRAR